VLDGVNVGEVALAVLPLGLPCGVLRLAVPTVVPPLAHPEGLLSGPQTWKLTVPCGAPPAAFPVTFAVSVL
jgi:hypothetical protein